MYSNANLLKKLVVVVLICHVSSVCYGQASNFRIGLQLSPAFSWMTTDDPLIRGTGTNLGMTVGAMAEFHLGEHFAVLGGLNLAFNRGGTLRHDIGGNFFPESVLSDDIFNSGAKPLPDGVKLKYSLQYLEFPIGLKLRTSEFGLFRYYADLPVLTWGIRTQARGAIDGGDIQAEDENIGDDVEVINFTWGIGIGVEYALSLNMSLVGGLYYTRGFNDITLNKGTRAEDNPNQNPSDPNDDYLISRENSRGVPNTLTLKIGILF